tara:strand:+ start:2179 stop:3141 length:963 start_codon:yes stop_codon:yes gene_type:complete
MENQNLPAWKKALTDSYPKFQALNPERAKAELGFAMSLFQSNVNLQKCDPNSILNSVVSVARTSITLNPVMRLAYLIPRKNQCVLEFSYMGLVALLRDNGCIRTISAHIVYEDEEFEYNLGDNKIVHKPSYAKTEQEHNLRQVIGCYSRATLPTGDVTYEFMPMWEIDKVKKMSVGSGSQYSAWNTWKDEMIKKSVIKRHFKMLISTNTNQALHTALKIENDNNQLINSFTGTNNNKSLMNAFDDVEVEENTQSLLFEEKEKDINKISDNELDKLMSLEAEKISTEPKEVFKQDYTIKPKITDDIKDKELDDLFKDKKKG